MCIDKVSLRLKPRRTRRRTAAYAAGLAGALSLACGGVEIHGDRRVPFTPENDFQFAEFFADHHRMAIRMATELVERGKRDDVKEIAARIAAQQTEELEILENAVADLEEQRGTRDENGNASPPPSDPHSETDRAFIGQASGEQLEIRFLLDMIAHHASGLPPAHRAPVNLERRDLRRLAVEVYDAQSAEIGEMRAILDTMDVSDAGDDRAAFSEERPDIGLVGDRRVPLTPANDVDFVDFFISHHEMAIDMAEDVIERGEDDRVQALAQNIRETQAAELETMRSIRSELAGSPEPPPMPPDPHLDPEVALMSKLSGALLDRLFLIEMIPHHASGIPTAHRAEPHVQHPTLRDMADGIYKAQGREIGEMHSLLEELANAPVNH